MKGLSFINLSFVKKWKFSEKRVLWASIGIVAAILIYVLGVLPLVEMVRKSKEEIVLKKRVLVKYEEFLQNRKTVEEELDRVSKQYEGIQQKLLPGETPQLGAAHLQEVVKKVLEKNGMAIRSFRILEPKEISGFRKISIHIDFNPTSKMSGLMQFIQDIEQNEKELMISEMDLLVPNPRAPNMIQGSLVVSGLMKADQAQEKKKEG
ncbi:MAG: hypothetical protein A2V86_01345 [Deltaproteobacteria bacterium RBG_16_49_23]|nr:MAG: hypothetical protein A2V86_01345 [Deltaproteobacteria bacterium RBG_16_49_23]